MNIHISHPELETRLTQSAERQGRSPDDLVRDALQQYLDEESRFVAAVRRGEDSLRRGDFLTHEEVGERLKRFLQPA